MPGMEGQLPVETERQAENKEIKGSSKMGPLKVFFTTLSKTNLFIHPPTPSFLPGEVMCFFLRHLATEVLLIGQVLPRGRLSAN